MLPPSLMALYFTRSSLPMMMVVMIMLIIIRQVKLNTKYYENCETVLMKYLKDACGLIAFSDQVIIITYLSVLFEIMSSSLSPLSPLLSP